MSFLSIIILFQGFPLMLTSCLDNCSGQGLYYRLSELNGEAKEYIPTNPGWQTRPWSNSINLTTEKLLLEFVFEEEYLDKKDFRRAEAGLPQLYACSPAINLEAGIEKFELFSDRDFNSNFPAGTDLSDIILIANMEGRDFAPFEIFIDTTRNALIFTHFSARFFSGIRTSGSNEFYL